MDTNFAQVNWTQEQWDRVQKTVADEARRARVGASFAPVTGPLDPTVEAIAPLTLGTQNLPPPRGAAGAVAPPARLWVDTDPTLRVTTFSSLVYLRGAELADPALAAALGMFRRAATVIARAEDALLFRGQPGAGAAPAGMPVPFPGVLEIAGGGVNAGLLPAVDPALPVGSRAALLNPGARQLVDASGGGPDLVRAVVAAIARLESLGHPGPFALILSDQLTQVACMPTASFVMPRDRILPFISGDLLRSSTVADGYGIIVSLGSSPIELVVATDINVKFLQVTTEPRYLFRVSERVAFRLKEQEAIAILYTA